MGEEAENQQTALSKDEELKQLGIEQPGMVVDPDGDSETITPDEERRLVRKIDGCVLPMMCFVFFMQYIDKQSLSYASVFGLLDDLSLTSEQYSWCSSIFYVGQLVAEYPFIYLMSKLPLTRFVAVTVVIWGIICMCLAAPKAFPGFAAVRFLLGFSEGAVSPAFVTLTAIWYQKDEHATRTALWVSMNGLAQVIGCLLMYGVGKNTSLSLDPWRTLFLICGALTAFCGVLFYFIVPQGPRDAWFLNEREKRVLTLRMARSREGGDKTVFSMAQLREALLDAKTWFVFAFGVLVTMQSPVLTFASLVIKNLGFDALDTMLYTAPSGAIQIAMLWIGVLGTSILPQNRTLVVLALILVPLAGNVLLMKLDPLTSPWGVIVSSWFASCITAVMAPLLSLTASNVKGNTKRSVVNTAFFIGYCAGCIGSPQLWTHSPRYFEGVVTAIVTWVLLFIVVVAYRVVCMRDNAARDSQGQQQQGSGGIVALDNHGAPIADMTDKEDSEFRYSY